MDDRVTTEPGAEHAEPHEAEGRRESWERMAQDIASKPAVAGMLQRAMAAKARADEVGVAALHGLNLPTQGDIDEMNARLRSVSVRTERIEELLEEVLTRLD